MDGQPSPTASLDTSDDGVKVVSNNGILVIGVNTLSVTVDGVGGYLTGWMDFNGNNQFDSNEKLTWTLNGTNLGDDAVLVPGTFNLQITIPAGTVTSQPIAARFRWGEKGLSFDGPSHIGEVEDYYFSFTAASQILLGDYNRNGVVDTADYVMWSVTRGQTVTPFSGADGNGNGIIDQGDYDVWRAHLGQTAPAAGAGALVATTSDSQASNVALASASAIAGEDAGLLDGSRGTSSGQSYGILEPAAAVPPAPPADATAPIVVNVSSSDSQANAALLSGFAVDAGQTAGDVSGDTNVVQSVTASTESSNSELLLMDQAWASVSDNSYDHASDSVSGDQAHDDASANDLALAAVLNEDDSWWDPV